jgi:hypothetical protein
MHLPRRRLRATRRFARPATPAPASAPIPASDPPPGEEPPRKGSNDTTVELASIPLEIVEAPSAGRGPEPRPPQKMEFSCACGASLVATAETYDKQSRCGMCQTVLLLNLVYDADCRSFEIVPFRVDPRSGP